MHAQALHRRAGSAVAALVAVLLLCTGPASAAAGEARGDDTPTGEAREASVGDRRASDRPPAHAGRDDDGPPPHAHSPAPENRPPAHARARRASVRADGDDGRAEEPRTDRGDGDAPGRSDGPSPAPVTDPHTELDTDVVDPDATRPLPDRAPTAVSSPVVVAAPSDPQPTSPTPSRFVPAPSGDAVAPALPRDVAPGADPQPTPDLLAAPPSDAALELFAAEDVTRRVVVPVLVLVAALIYLLAQGRIDRGGQLLTAPEVLGTEHDDDVFDL